MREVASFVRLFKKAGSLVACLGGRRQVEPGKGQKVAIVDVRPAGTTVRGWLSAKTAIAARIG